MYLFEAQVKIPVSTWHNQIKVQIRANSVPEAWGMLKAQYGENNVIGAPVKLG